MVCIAARSYTGGVNLMKKDIIIHNKSDRPDNIVLQENQTIESCIGIENSLPHFFKEYFLFLKNSIGINTRLAYLTDIHFFCRYLIENTDLTEASDTRDITAEDFERIKARDVNFFLGDYCSRYYKETQHTTQIFENHNRALARKRSSLSSLFKFLYRNEQKTENISPGFNPIKLPRPQPDAIKKLEIDEVARMLDLAETGSGFTETQKKYWEKTKLRDKAILLMFVTYGLRLNELQQLNISSFNFSRGEFRIYRKRAKESLMPLNQTVEDAVSDYIKNERPPQDKLPEGERDALFLSLQNKRMTSKAIRELVKKYTSIVLGTSAKSGYSPHKLRATAASTLIEYGFSIYDVQNLLDHDNVTTTQIYAAHKKNVKREIIKNFEWSEDLGE
ncbi:MAG: tyrosine-type recombinase/integrase [Peptoclostridium sp.]|nr:tyrosine-type recombinase/integrase [Peptoclostridium sp.]